MKIDLYDVTEQDMDMLIIEEFICNESLRNLFYDHEKVKLCHNFLVSEAYRSLSDEDGESDITFILSDGKTKVAILIEDKIDAIAMPNQRARYDIRGHKGIENGQYNSFYVFMFSRSCFCL